MLAGTADDGTCEQVRLCADRVQNKLAQGRVECEPIALCRFKEYFVLAFFYVFRKAFQIDRVVKRKGIFHEKPPSVLSEASQKGQTFFGCTGLRRAVNGDQTECHGITLLPFKVIDQAPVEVAFYRDAIINAVLDTV